jgi:hypothetical protein
VEGQYISGLVLDHQGKPLGEIDVNYTYKNCDGTILANAEGKFTIERVPTDVVVTIFVLDGKYACMLKASSKQRTSVTLRLSDKETGIITGKIIDADNKPISTFDIEQTYYPEGGGGCSSSDFVVEKKGNSFTIHTQPWLTTTLTIEVSGCSTISLPRDKSRYKVPARGKKDLGTIQVSQSPPRTTLVTAGKILEPDGTPFEGTLQFFEEEAYTNGTPKMIARCEANKQGEFRVEGLAKGILYVIHASSNQNGKLKTYRCFRVKSGNAGTLKAG